METQSLSNLKLQLSSDISNLNNLHDVLTEKAETVGSKKTEMPKQATPFKSNLNLEIFCFVIAGLVQKTVQILARLAITI